MTINTEDDVTAALEEIGRWYADAPLVGDRPSAAPKVRKAPGLPLRAAAVALLLVAGAIVGLALVGGSESTTTTDAGPTNAQALPDRSTVFDLCDDPNSTYDVERLREGGSVHVFDDPASSRTYHVITSGSLHLLCGLAQRENGAWFRVMALADTHLPLASSATVSVLNAVEIDGRTFVFGQVGADVATVEVDPTGDGATQPVIAIDGDWWGASFSGTGEPAQAFPGFTVRWTTVDGRSFEADGSDLISPTPWRLCRENPRCRDERLVELQELANGRESPGQAAVLADGLVSEDEYRASLRSWGLCIGDATGADVSFDDDGLFVVRESGADTQLSTSQDAFDECKAAHVDLVIEAAGLIGIEDG